MALCILGVQLVVSLIMGFYFLRQMKKQRLAEGGGPRGDANGEMEKLRRLRAVHLNLPLSEQTRPKAFSDIIGQEEGIEALKAILCGPNPQHVIIYGPPGVGKTCAARLVLEEAKRRGDSAFANSAPFVEMDATCARFDERAIADPLIGSVHDPIYQGAGALGVAGIPQPKPGAVTKAHGGILFLDEIGELHPMQMNKLLKVLEDRRVLLESAYYNPNDNNVPRHIHDIFQNGLPADFRLVGATTRGPESISPALRSRCMEIFFRPLTANETALIARKSAISAGVALENDCDAFIGSYAQGGRDAANLTQVAAGIARSRGRTVVTQHDVEYVVRAGGYARRLERRLPGGTEVGRISGLAVTGANQGVVLPIEAVAFPRKPNAEGRPQWRATGIVDSEQINTGDRTMTRRSTASAALDNVYTVLKRLGLDVDGFDLHLDFPGGVPVDGPSAGVAMGLAAHSALTGRPLSGSLALTGELGIDGAVLPVGGVPTKVRAALDSGAELVLIPRENWEDAFADEPRVQVVDRFEQALALAQPPVLEAGKEALPLSLPA